MTLSPPPQFVVTGFEPFGSHAYNPSGDAARTMAEVCRADAHLLAVTYDEAARFASAQLHATPAAPMLFIHLGLGAKRSRICFEHRAKNERDHRPDNIEKYRDEDRPTHRNLLVDGRDEFLSSTDIPALVDAYNDDVPDGLPAARISDDCGSYVCNALLYHSLLACERARDRGRWAAALFLHIPLLEPDEARDAGRRLGEVFSSRYRG